MLRLVHFIPTAIFYIVLFSFYCIFEVILRVSKLLFGYKGLKFSIEIITFLTLVLAKIVGLSFGYKNSYKLPKNRSLIFISNHQSFLDIPAMLWHFRKYNSSFIVKKELEKGFPSVSYYLKAGNSVLIDRKKPKYSLELMDAYSKQAAQNNWSTIIYPEGTRSKYGKMKKFKDSGLQVLFKNIPNALIVPVVVNHSWKLNRWSYLPLPLGVSIKIEVQEPIELNTQDKTTLVKQLEDQIRSKVVS